MPWDFTAGNLASLKVVPDSDDQRPYNFKEIPALDPQKVQLLSADPVIGAKLDKIIQRAQFMLYYTTQQSTCE